MTTGRINQIAIERERTGPFQTCVCADSPRKRKHAGSAEHARGMVCFPRVRRRRFASQPKPAGNPPRVGPRETTLCNENGSLAPNAFPSSLRPRLNAFGNTLGGLSLFLTESRETRPVFRLQTHCSSRERGHFETRSSCRTRECFRTISPQPKATRYGHVQSRGRLISPCFSQLLAGKPVRATRPHTAVGDEVRFSLLLWRVISHPHM